jgi:hypothetical protein
VLNLTGSQLVLALVFDVGWGVLGYFLAENDKRNLGRTPWGIPSAVWAMIWFLSGLIGVVLWFFAHRAEVRRAAQGPLAPLGGSPTGPGPAPVRSVASDFPAYPRPADGGAPPAPIALPASSGPAAPTPPAPPPPTPPAGASPPAWHPDPSGRYHYRWWTGSEWTSYVATHGRVEVDVHPDQRIGPY